MFILRRVWRLQRWLGRRSTCMKISIWMPRTLVKAGWVWWASCDPSALEVETGYSWSKVASYSSWSGKHQAQYEESLWKTSNVTLVCTHTPAPKCMPTHSVSTSYENIIYTSLDTTHTWKKECKLLLKVLYRIYLIICSKSLCVRNLRGYCLMGIEFEFRKGNKPQQWAMTVLGGLVNLTPTRGVWKEGNSTEEMPLSDWSVV